MRRRTWSTALLLLVGAWVSSARAADRDTVRRLIDSGEYTRAEEVLRAAPGPDRERRSWESAFLAEALVGAGRGAESDTLALAQKAVALSERGVNSNDLETAASLRVLGAVHSQRAEHELAKAALGRAVELWRTVGPRASADLRKALAELAATKLRLHETPAAKALLEEAALLGATAADDHGEALILEVRARLACEEQRYDDALALANTARAKREAAQRDHPALVATYNLLGEVEWFRFRYEEGRAWNERALALARRTLGEDHPQTAASLGDLAITEFVLGDVEASTQHHERSLEIVRTRFGDRHRETGLRMLNVAIHYLERGDYIRAMNMFETVIAHIPEDDSQRAERLGYARFNLALLLIHMGDATSARVALEQALALWEQALGADHHFIARPLEELGSLLDDAGDWTGARALLRRAASIRSAEQGERSLDHARVLAQLALVAQRLGDAEDAARNARDALAIISASDNTANAYVPYVLSGLARYESSRQNWKAAAQHWEAALGILRPLGPNHPQVAQVQGSLASALLDTHELDDAVAHAARAESARHSHIRRTVRYVAESQALKLAGQRGVGRDVLLTAAAARTTRPDFAAHAFRALVEGRALVLDEMASRHRHVQTLENAEARTSRKQLDALRQRLAFLVYRQSETLNTSAVAVIDEVERNIEDAERRLAALTGMDTRSFDQGPVDAARLASHLPPHSALVSYARYEQGPAARYVAFVLRPETRVPVVLPLGDAATIEADIAAWRATLRDVHEALTGGPMRLRRLHDIGARLHTRLWKPLAKATSGATLVLVVPDGSLSLINFNALPSSAHRHLVEEKQTIHHLSSERELLTEPLPAANRSLLALGGPDFDATSPRVDAPVVDDATVRLALRGPCHGSRFEPLVHAALEAQEIAELWSATAAGEGELRVGATASEEELRRLSPGRGVLHLATHGFFLDDGCPDASKTPARAASVSANPLVRSGLALAGANNRSSGPESDGLLTSAEIASLDLRQSSLVVLSSCGSALGPIQDGEGVLGLRRAFAIAGARTVILSLWSVDDRLARDFMSLLYAALLEKQSSVSEAMRTATLALLRDLPRKGLPPDPALWAPFIATGDWR